MNLIAIYNVWDGLELLRGSIEQIRSEVDCVLIVAQSTSNFGEYSPEVYPYCNSLVKAGLVDELIKYEPSNPGQYAAQINETVKRQMGIEFAKLNGYTHFLHLDCDEYYDTDEFRAAKLKIEALEIPGTYVPLWTYYKHPFLRVGIPEGYFVPFIHRVDEKTNTGIQNDYPVLVDPTRRINQPATLISGVWMHHFSYVRLDIERKLQNSTARKNLKKAQILQEYKEAKPGSFLKAVFNRKLVEVEDKFNIHERLQEYSAVFHTLGQSG